MAPQANFQFFHARLGHTINGIRASEVADPYRDRQGVVPSLIVGPQLRARSDKPVRWARIIPPGMKDLPTFASDGDRGEKIVRGSIEQIVEGQQTKTYLVSHRDDKAYYVLVRTGLVVKNGSTVADRLEIQKSGRLVTHGSYSFDQAAIRVAAAENEATLGSVFADPKVQVGRVEAERIGAKAVGKKIPLIGSPESSYVLWKMPIGSVLLIRDVNGTISRLVAQKDQLRHVDATNYGSFFDQLESSFKILQEKQRAEKREAQQAAVAVEAPGAPTSKMAEALAPLVAKQ